MTPVQPLVLTLALDHEAQARFDALRRAHFPPQRNHLAAHVTLFHALPGDHETAVREELERAAERAPFAVRVTRVRFLGRGVAYDLDAPELTAVRTRLAAQWEPWLTPQDRAWRGAHVTVQNKVHPDAARALRDELAAGFVAYDVRACGLALWRYLGGPWEPLARYDFAD